MDMLQPAPHTHAARARFWRAAALPSALPALPALATLLPISSPSSSSPSPSSLPSLPLLLGSSSCDSSLSESVISTSSTPGQAMKPPGLSSSAAACIVERQRAGGPASWSEEGGGGGEAAALPQVVHVHLAGHVVQLLKLWRSISRQRGGAGEAQCTAPYPPGRQVGNGGAAHPSPAQAGIMHKRQPIVCSLRLNQPAPPRCTGRRPARRSAPPSVAQQADKAVVVQAATLVA